jgi:hypothetical protein
MPHLLGIRDERVRRLWPATLPEVFARTVLLPRLIEEVRQGLDRDEKGDDVSRHGQPTPLCECGNPLEPCRCGELRCYFCDPCDPIAGEPEDQRWDCDDWEFRVGITSS